MENNISKPSENFSDPSLGNSEISFLNNCEKNIRNIVSENATKIGEQLYKAQQRLASFNNGGVFARWIKHLGFNSSSAYNYINRYTTFQKLESENEIKAFENLPKTLSYDISKPSANKKLKQAVLNGDITTHKEYKALEAKLKQKEQELAERDETIANQNDELEEHRKTELELNKTLQERPRPKTKTVVKEVQVKPDDYENIKQENAELHKRHKALADELDKKDEELKDYADIASENRKVLHWQNKGKLSAYKLSSSIRDFISSSYMSSEDREAVESAGKEAQQKLNEQLNDLQRWLDDMRQLTNGRHIVEGEIINE